MTMTHNYKYRLEQHPCDLINAPKVEVRYGPARYGLLFDSIEQSRAACPGGVLAYTFTDGVLTAVELVP